MENDKLNILFEKLQGTFDIEEPNNDHRQLFLEKLKASKGGDIDSPEKEILVETLEHCRFNSSSLHNGHWPLQYP